MGKLVVLVSALFVALAFGITPTSAAYDSSGDIILNVNLMEDNLQFSDSTGEQSFQLQEDAHSTLTKSSGQEVDHSYVWIKINGKKVLAVDPPKPCF